MINVGRDDEKLEGHPTYSFGEKIDAVEQVFPDGRRLVRLPDGSHAMAIPLETVKRQRECSRKALQEWRAKVGEQQPDDPRLQFMDALLEDARANAFWDWVTTLEPQWWRNVTTITDQLFRATRLPQKPGNFSPKQRESYLLEVRELARKLASLLADTRFDYTAERELGDEELDKPMRRALDSWGAENEEAGGHVVAYRVDPQGVFGLDYDFPDCALTTTLDHLVEWTCADDYWGRSIFHSSAPIRQANSKSVRTQYFNCSIWRWFHDHGVDIPYAVLASVAEVCLQLGANETLDEGTVKKQVGRYRQRVGQTRNGKAYEPEGRISLDGDDFVLSRIF